MKIQIDLCVSDFLLLPDLSKWNGNFIQRAALRLRFVRYISLPKERMIVTKVNS